MSSLNQEDRWSIITAFFKEKGLVRQHLDSYNDFIRHGLQYVIDEIKVIELESSPDMSYYIKLGKLELDREPDITEAEGLRLPILPVDARLRNLSYSTQMYLTMIPVVNGEDQDPVRVNIGRLPVMLKSVACPLSRMTRDELVRVNEDPDDPGGYFIVNGAERCIVTQEDLAVNRILLDHGPSGSTATHFAKVFSATPGFRAPVTLERNRDGMLHVVHPSIPTKTPVPVLIRALGIATDKEIVEMVSNDQEIQRELLPTLEQASQIATVEDALDYIGTRVAIGQVREFRIQRAQQILDRYFLPHIGSTPETRRKKALFIGQMTERLLEFILGRRMPDDKDHYSNKRLKLAGDLLASLFRVAFRSLHRDLKYQIEKVRTRDRPLNLETLVRADIVTERLRHALATGNWVGGKAGVSQLLDRTNHISTLSHLRRVVSPLSRSQPHFEARDLHPTQWGRLCPNETPEGPNCGLVKNLALMAYISVGVDEGEVEGLLYDLGVVPIEEARTKLVAGTKIYLNGRLVGIARQADLLLHDIRKRRRRGLLSDEVNVALHRDKFVDEIQVNCDPGRVRRPLIIAENGKPKSDADVVDKVHRGEWTWSNLIREGIVEYLDTEEEENALVAISPENLTPQYTHLEISVPSVFGICASTIPYSEHNQSPRNTYQSAMAKQALGFPTASLLLRLDSRAHLLHYPQKPLVTTKGIEAIGFDKRPSGQNFIVAVLSYSGYNIEDAVIIGKGAIERGLGRSTFLRSYESEEKRYPGGEEDRMEIPEPTVRGYRTAEAYRQLEEDGVASLESPVGGGDVIIGKTSPPRFAGEYRELGVGAQTRRETSTSMRHGERGTIDTVIITETMDRNPLIRVKVRDERIPELGDKFASRHGQKGVIGLIVQQADMPFTESGITPDIIINPHGLPARMTVGQLMESIAGKVAATEGRFADGTPFTGETEDDIRESLAELGFKHNGCEVLVDGRTGEILKGEVFIGVVYYQKLHHMVADKMHGRARGPVQILTRQPTEGRAREGGLRFGEMERDCLIGHGAALLLKERLLDQSDRYVVYACGNCGFLAYHDAKREHYVCSLCGDRALISPVTVSYAFKLLLQELTSLGVAVKLQLGAIG